MSPGSGDAASSTAQSVIFAHRSPDCKRSRPKSTLTTVFPDPHGITDLCIDALVSHAHTLDREQAVYGIDAAKETQVHEILELGIADSPIGLCREVPYPSSGDTHTRLSARPRCDLVLTPHPQSGVIDPVARDRERADAERTLFADVHESVLTREPHTCEPEDAMWIEIKSVAQHACRDGVYTPNTSYAHELTHGLSADVAKLALDERVWHAAVLLVVFTETEDVAERDTASAVSIAASRGLPVRTPIVRSAPISDRGGNACLSVALVPVAC